MKSVIQKQTGPHPSTQMYVIQVLRSWDGDTKISGSIQERKQANNNINK